MKKLYFLLIISTLWSCGNSNSENLKNQSANTETPEKENLRIAELQRQLLPELDKMKNIQKPNFFRTSSQKAMQVSNQQKAIDKILNEILLLRKTEDPKNEEMKMVEIKPEVLEKKPEIVEKNTVAVERKPEIVEKKMVEVKSENPTIVGCWELPTNHRIKIKFSGDNKFIFTDYNKKSGNYENLTGTWQHSNEIINFKYSDRPAQKFNYLKSGNAFVIEVPHYHFEKKPKCDD